MQTLYIIPIEPIETRYTKHWYKYVPDMINRNTPDDIKVTQLDFDWDDTGTSDGAFLNFASTTRFKSKQMENLASFFESGIIENGDGFLFMDYWNPIANMIQYMSVLNGVSIKIMGICHAGYWDEHDILGQQFSKDENLRKWIVDTETSLDSLYEAKFFATEFSRSLYERSYSVMSDRNFVTGFPMGYYDLVMTPYWELDNRPVKENIVCFPHRKSLEKGLEEFYALEKQHPEYHFIVSMDVCKDKEEYHDLLYRSKFCFSASKQETLGISMGIEALRAGCDVFVPDRLSYEEMFFDEFKYYDSQRPIHTRLRNGPNSLDLIKKQHDYNYSKFFSGEKMYQQIVDTMRRI